MLQGLDINTLREEVRRRSLTKKDYTLPARDLEFQALMAEANRLAGGDVLGGPAVDIGRGSAHLVNPEWYANPLTFRSRAQAQLDGTELALYKPATTSLLIPMGGPERLALPMNPLANRQLAGFLDIPATFYDRLQAQFPRLLEENVNTLLKAQHASKYRLVRSLDGMVRAVLSDSYETRDNWDLMRFLMPLFSPKDTQLDDPDGTVIRHLRNPDGSPINCKFASVNITDNSLYIKVVVPRMKVQLAVGATIRAGVIIKNSEVGLGSTCVWPFYEVLECTNGAYIELYGTTKRHVGKAKGGSFGSTGLGGDGDNDASRFFSDNTKYQDDKAFFLKMVDVVRGTLTEATFNRMLEPLRASMGVEITGHPAAAVEVVGRHMNLGEGEQEEILRHLYQATGNRKPRIYDVSQAITRYAQDVESYDRATELEGIGGKVIALDPREWRVIAEATKTRKPGNARSNGHVPALAGA